MTNSAFPTTVASSLVAAVLGAGVGLVTTFAHRQYVVDLGIPAPFGIFIGLAIVGALLVGLRLVFDSRIVAAAGAVGVLGAILVLTIPGAGGSQVVFGDAIGFAWALAPVVIAAVVVGMPFRRRRGWRG